MTIDTEIRLGCGVKYRRHRLVVAMTAFAVAADHFNAMPLVTLGAIRILSMGVVAFITGDFGMRPADLGKELFRLAVTDGATVGRQILRWLARRRVVRIVTTEAVFLDFSAGMTVVAIETVR